jgi:hypothetical protein
MSLRRSSLALIALVATGACVDVPPPSSSLRAVSGRAIGADVVLLAFDNGTFEGDLTSDTGDFGFEVPANRSFTIRFYDDNQRTLGHALFAATRDGAVQSQVVPAGDVDIDLGVVDASVRSCTGLPVGDNPLEVSDHDGDGVVDIDDEDALAFADVVDFCVPRAVVID